MYELASLAKNTQAPLISSGSATLPFIISSFQLSSKCGNCHMVSSTFSFFKDNLVMAYWGSHFRSYVSWGNRVDPDFVLVQFCCNRWAHGSNCSLGSTVRCTHLTSDGHVTCNACDQNDASLLRSILDHQFRGKLSGVINSEYIHPKKLCMLLYRGIEE